MRRNKGSLSQFSNDDDFLDYAGSKSDLGKNIDDDFREKKYYHNKIFEAKIQLILHSGRQLDREQKGGFEVAQNILKSDGR